MKYINPTIVYLLVHLSNSMDAKDIKYHALSGGHSRFGNSKMKRIIYLYMRRCEQLLSLHTDKQEDIVVKISKQLA